MNSIAKSGLFNEEILIKRWSLGHLLLVMRKLVGEAFHFNYQLFLALLYYMLNIVLVLVELFQSKFLRLAKIIAISL